MNSQGNVGPEFLWAPQKDLHTINKCIYLGFGVTAFKTWRKDKKILSSK